MIKHIPLADLETLGFSQVHNINPRPAGVRSYAYDGPLFLRIVDGGSRDGTLLFDFCGGNSEIRSVDQLRRLIEAIKEGQPIGRQEKAAPKPDDDGPYCKECGEDDSINLAYIDGYADSYRYRCRVCGHEFSTKRREREE